MVYEMRGGLDQVDFYRVFGIYFLNMIDFKWGVEQYDFFYSLKRCFWLLCRYGLYKDKRRSKEM